MRTIDRKLIDAIRQQKSATIGPNLRTEAAHGGGLCILRVLLHGHAVAILTHSGGELDAISVGQCGWVTATTHARINAVLSAFAPGWRTGRKHGEGYITGPDGAAQPMGHMGRSVVQVRALPVLAAAA